MISIGIFKHPIEVIWNQHSSSYDSQKCSQFGRILGLTDPTNMVFKFCRVKLYTLFLGWHNLFFPVELQLYCKLEWKLLDQETIRKYPHMYYILFCFLGVPRMGCIRVYRCNVTCSFTSTHTFMNLSISVWCNLMYFILFSCLYI